MHWFDRLREKLRKLDEKLGPHCWECGAPGNVHYSHLCQECYGKWLLEFLSTPSPREQLRRQIAELTDELRATRSVLAARR